MNGKERFPTFVAFATWLRSRRAPIWRWVNTKLLPWVFRKPTKTDGTAYMALAVILGLTTYTVGVYGPYGMNNEDGQIQMVLQNVIPFLAISLVLARLLGARITWWLYVSMWGASFSIALLWCVNNRVPDVWFDALDEPDSGVEWVAMQTRYRLNSMHRDLDRLTKAMQAGKPDIKGYNGLYRVPAANGFYPTGITLVSRELALSVWRETAPRRVEFLKKAIIDDEESLTKAEEDYRHWTIQRRLGYFGPDIWWRYFACAWAGAMLLTGAAVIRKIFDLIAGTIRRRRPRRESTI